MLVMDECSGIVADYESDNDVEGPSKILECSKKSTQVYSSEEVFDKLLIEVRHKENGHADKISDKVNSNNVNEHSIPLMKVSKGNDENGIVSIKNVPHRKIENKVDTKIGTDDETDTSNEEQLEKESDAKGNKNESEDDSNKKESDDESNKKESDDIGFEIEFKKCDEKEIIIDIESELYIEEVEEEIKNSEHVENESDNDKEDKTDEYDDSSSDNDENKPDTYIEKELYPKEDDVLKNEEQTEMKLYSEEEDSEQQTDDEKPVKNKIEDDGDITKQKDNQVDVKKKLKRIRGSKYKNNNYQKKNGESNMEENINHDTDDECNDEINKIKKSALSNLLNIKVRRLEQHEIEKFTIKSIKHDSSEDENLNYNHKTRTKRKPKRTMPASKRSKRVTKSEYKRDIDTPSRKFNLKSRANVKFVDNLDNIDDKIHVVNQKSKRSFTSKQEKPTSDTSRSNGNAGYRKSLRNLETKKTKTDNRDNDSNYNNLKKRSRSNGNNSESNSKSDNYIKRRSCSSRTDTENDSEIDNLITKQSHGSNNHSADEISTPRKSDRSTVKRSWSVDEDDDDDRRIVKRVKSNESSDENTKQSRRTRTSQEDQHELNRLKKLVSVANLRIKNYSEFFTNCTTVKDKKNKMIEFLREKGLRGTPSFSNCKKLAKKLERTKEISELDTRNIISDSESTPVHLGSRSHSLYEEEGKYSESVHAKALRNIGTVLHYMEEKHNFKKSDIQLMNKLNNVIRNNNSDSIVVYALSSLLTYLNNNSLLSREEVKQISDIRDKIKTKII